MDISRMTNEEIITLVQECQKEIRERNKRNQEKLINELRSVIKKITDQEGYELHLYINYENKEMSIFDERDVEIQLT